MKRDKGITLVALVITVIVLLILAGVAISSIAGEDGIFSKTRYAADKYNNAAENEAKAMNELIENPYLNKTQLISSYFDVVKKVNTPDTSKLSDQTTKYVTYTDTAPYQEILSNEVPSNWFDYNSSKWANIKTTSTDKSLEAYWVWIPRFAYKLPESSTAKTIEVAFVKGTSKTVVLSDGTEVQGYYSTDTAITTDGSGIYSKKTSDATSKWIIHPAFTFGDKQLNGIWVAKYEASSSNTSATNGGDNTTELKVQVKPSVVSWKNIAIENMFTVSRAIQATGGVLGTSIEITNEESNVNSHLMKNIEWGAVGILSQSKFGFYVSGVSQQIWNNPDSSYMTGMSGNSPDDSGVVHDSCNTYNTANGVKTSTTGNPYGVYDMAGGVWEIVFGIYDGAISKFPTVLSKYYDKYANSTGSYVNYSSGKIGDMNAELLPIEQRTWNNDYSGCVHSVDIYTYRGGGASGDIYKCTGIFASTSSNGRGGFRPVLVVM